jgi:heme-degrading monooxygenase HmoA
MKVKAGRENDFEQAWALVAEQTKQHPDNCRQALLRDLYDPTQFIITSDWVSQEAFRSFERSEEQDLLTAPLRELRESAKMSIHQLVTHVEKETGSKHLQAQI